MVKGIHFLLTYHCTFECDHCFLYCSPRSTGTFTTRQLQQTLDEAVKLGTVEWIFFEGGEPLLYYPLLLEGIKRAKTAGFKVGMVTNAYPIQTPEDALVWLKPLKELEIDSLSISIDSYHCSDITKCTGSIAYEAASALNLPVNAIEIQQTSTAEESDQHTSKGQPILEGGPKFRGRAADLLTEGMVLQKPEDFLECPYEELVSPNRVHVDAFGNVHICQGILMGNMWDIALSKLIKEYNVKEHPICAPLQEGGPHKLAKALNVSPAAGYADACHFCFLIRREKLRDFEDYLGPKQIYGENPGTNSRN